MSIEWKDSGNWSYNPGARPGLTERFKGKLFDSFMGQNSHPTQNHAIRLLLRVYLKPANGKASARDFNGTSFPAKNWTEREWSGFKEKFARQSSLWNNRFWLIPPKNFSALDNKLNGRLVRPNVQCFLDTEIAASEAGAHRTIDVVNLDVDAIRRQRGSVTSGTFRSSSRQYDSLDVEPRNTSYTDDQGIEHTIKGYYTIAHEIGHAIGLPHVGVLKSRPHCKFAIALKSMGVMNVSSHLQKGSNSQSCYGRFDTLGLAENIMGLGMRFEEINAQPWLDTVAMHTNTLVAHGWKAILSYERPRPV